MFRLSKAAEYSIRGILHLSINYSEDRLCDIEEIAKATGTPPAYLAKQPKDIKLLDVIEAMEGPLFLNYCLIYEGYCERDKMCPVHDVWGGAQKVLVDYLSACSFEQLAIDEMVANHMISLRRVHRDYIISWVNPQTKPVLKDSCMN